MLDGFVREQKENILGMCLTEFNEEIAIQNWRQDGIIEGREQGIAEGAQAKAVEDAVIAVEKIHIPIDDVAREYGVDKSEIQSRLQPAPAN